MLSKEIQEDKPEKYRKLKESIELVEILVRGCFLRNHVGAQDAGADECDALQECGLWSLTTFERLLSFSAPPAGKDETVVEWISCMARGVASILEVMALLPRPLPQEARGRFAQLTSQADAWLNAVSAKQQELPTRNKEGGHQAGKALQRARDACYRLTSL